MAQKPEEIAWMKRLHFFWAVPRDSKTHNALHQPSRCQVHQHQNCWEAPRNTSIYWAGSEEVASEPVASAFQGLWRLADSQKKACPTRSENGANLGWSVQTFYTNLLVLLLHWTLKILQAFPAPPQNSQPRLCVWRCRLSLFSSKDIGHMPRCRAHRERQSGSGRSPRLWHTESSRNSSTPPLEGLMASTLKQILKENVKGRLLDYNGYKWRIVRKNWGISWYFHMAKLDEIN